MTRRDGGTTLHGRRLEDRRVLGDRSRSRSTGLPSGASAALRAGLGRLQHVELDADRQHDRGASPRAAIRSRSRARAARLTHTDDGDARRPGGRRRRLLAGRVAGEPDRDGGRRRPPTRSASPAAAASRARVDLDDERPAGRRVRRASARRRSPGSSSTLTLTDRRAPRRGLVSVHDHRHERQRSMHSDRARPSSCSASASGRLLAQRHARPRRPSRPPARRPSPSRSRRAAASPAR